MMAGSGMSRVAILCLFSAAFASAVDYPTKLSYTKNQVLTYNINGYLDARGYDDTEDFQSGGGYSTMTGILVFQVLDVNTDVSQYFMSMNMYNVNVEANDTNVPPPRKLSAPSNLTPLGDTAFVWQMFNGTILKVGFSRNDPSFFIEVKLGAVNSLQTHIVAPGDKTQVLTLDPVGSYMANIDAVGGKQLTITKNFTQSNVEHFTDPTVSPDNVLITAGTVTTVSLEGVITSAIVDQFVQLVNLNTINSSSAVASDPNSNTSALDVDLSSRGRLEITLGSTDGPSPFNMTEIDELLNSPAFFHASMFEVGEMLIQAKAVHASRLGNLEATIDAALAEPTNQRKQWAVARYFAARPAEALMTLENRLKEGSDAVPAILHLLSRIDTEAAQALLVRYGLQAATEGTRQQAIMAALSFSKASPALVEAMREVSLETSLVSRMAVFALGSLYSRSSVAAEAADELLPRLKVALKENDVRAVSALLYAIANAGPEAVPSDHLAGVLASSDNSVQKALQRPVNYLMKQFNVITKSDNDLPFNRSWSGGVVVGGRKINGGFNASTFAGTNFNCNQTYFNYEVIGTAGSNVTLFRWHTSTFYSETIYGMINGQAAADHILVEIFGKVFYDEPLPAVDCFQETIPIFTQQVGLNKQYTLWISVIPVTFTATVQLSLNLDVQFEACIDKLSADVQLLPTATLTFGGGAQVDLLVVRAGVRLEGAFTSTLVPEVYIHGSECEVGVQATLQVPPQEVDLEGYSDIDICVLWVFDCHWGNEYTKKFLDWNYPGQNKVLYNQEWKIHL